MSADSGESVDVFVFPLMHATLFPRSSKPLNIFEPRYIKMINDAAETRTPVALAFSEPLSARAKEQGAMGQLRSIAGVGHVNILERRSDQTMLIMLEGIGKVHFDKIIETEEPYLKAKAHWLRESTTLANEHIFIMNRLTKALAAWLEMHVTDVAARTAFSKRLVTAEEKINAICSLMVLDAHVQQSLLELSSIDERCAQLGLSLEVDGPVQ